MERFSPRFAIGTGLMLIMFTALMALGTWQTDRLKWKQGLINRVTDMTANRFVPLEEVIVNYANFEDIAFTKVRFRGTFHHKDHFLLIPRTWEGHSGAHLYTPMTIQPTGHVVLVNRGWIPDRLDPAEVYQPEGEIEIIGYLQEPTLPGWMTPDNVTDENKAWYYLDLEAMQDELVKDRPEMAGRMLPFYCISNEQGYTQDFPKRLDPLTMIRNNHLGYALTWFGLAFALLIMYVIYVRKNKI